MAALAMRPRLPLPPRRLPRAAAPCLCLLLRAAQGRGLLDCCCVPRGAARLLQRAARCRRLQRAARGRRLLMRAARGRCLLRSARAA